MDAEVIKAYAPILIALFGTVTAIVTGYFSYRATITARAADTKADTAIQATSSLRRTLETTQNLMTQGMRGGTDGE